MTQNDCMDSKSEDVKLKEMRMAPDKVCPGPCPAGGPASSDGGGDGGECRPSSPLGPPTLPVPVALVTSMVHPSVALQLQQMKEGDGATAEGGEKGEGVGEDDDLTSLNWLLQDKNILKGINLRTAASGAQESPTSDYVDDSASEQGDSTCSSVNSSSPVPPNGASGSGRNKHPHHIPYDPKVHVTSKPPYSFSCLIFMAIEDCAEKALPVKEIYAWILDHFPYYKNAPTGWKNSVRHNLSLNKCFCKVEKAPNLGKGSLWMVDPVYRPNLVQALKKAPYHPYAVTGASSDRPVSSRTSQQPDSLSAAEQSDDVISTPTKSCAAAEPQPGRLLPDPDLFPYLSRRLLAAAAAAAAAAGGDHQRSHSSAAAAADSSDSQLDDVDAAAAMLALKHGPHVRMNIEQRKDEYHKQLTAVNLTSKGKKKSKDEDQDVLITSCPSEDHTYSVEHTQALHTEMYTYRFNNSTASSRAAIVKTEPTSPDEAFQEGSDSNSSWAVKAAKANGHRNSSSVAGGERDVEEQRKIAEGADALLNLAGIATSLRRSRSSTAAKRQRLQEDQVEATDEDEDEDRLVIKEEEEEEEERVPFRPRLLRKSPLKRDLMRREERKREKKACMKVLSYAQAIMESMEKNNNNSSSPPSTSPPSKVGGAKVRRKSLLAPVKHVAKVKR